MTQSPIEQAVIKAAKVFRQNRKFRLAAESEDEADIRAMREALRQHREWLPIESAPYDEMCLFFTVDGNVVQGFIYDGTHEDFGYSAWMPLPPPPAEGE